MVKQNTKITYKKIKNSNNGVCVCVGGVIMMLLKQQKKNVCWARKLICRDNEKFAKFVQDF